MRKSLAYLLLNIANMLKIMKPYRSEGEQARACKYQDKTGIHSTAWRMMYFGLLHHLIWCKIT